MPFSIQSTARNRQPYPFMARVSDPIDLLRVAFERLPYGVVVSDKDGAIQLANPRALAIFGYPLAELIDQPISRLLPGTVPAVPDDQWTAFWQNPHSATINAGQTIDGIRRDGVAVPLEVGLGVLDDGTTRRVITSMVDVTERVDLKARLAAAADEHAGLQRLVGDIAARLAATAPTAVDDAVADSLRHIGDALQLDCATLWHWRLDSRAQTEGGPSYSPPETLAMASIPYVIASLKAGDACCFTSVDDLCKSDREAFRRHGLRSAALVPLTSAGDGGPGLAALALGSTTREQEWTPAIVERLRSIAGTISQAFARCASDRALQDALEEIRRLRDRVVSENVELRREVKVLRTSRPVVSESDAIRQVLTQIEQVAPTSATVLLVGETGTGKEVMAQAVHDLSPRHQRQMIRVSCAAIPTSLIESELFGRERGAYTGALSRQIGRFEAANQSTLFLDEISELPMEVQVKLLRVLQERVIERLGSTTPVKVDVRIIAATNRNLEDAVRDKTFREDLYYRLNVFPVVVPPLRERVDDIPALVWSFIDEFSRSFGKTIESISKDSLRELQRYPWPGNVRELRNVIERAVIVATGRQLTVNAPRLGERQVPQNAMTLSALEVEHIRAVLATTGWRIRGAGGAAERLGLKPTTLESRMARLGIARKKAS